jgi:hypothetical protein
LNENHYKEDAEQEEDISDQGEKESSNDSSQEDYYDEESDNGDGIFGNVFHE